MRRVSLVLALALAVGATSARAFTGEEHRHLALAAFAPLLEGLNVTVTADSLAAITVRTSREDLSRARHHVRGRTPYQQASAFYQHRFEDIVSGVIADTSSAATFPAYADNVVANYLVYHAIALRCIEESFADAEGDDTPRVLPGHTAWIEHALVYEAVALGYLADAFSSSHMLTPVHRPFASLQDANVRAAHAFFATHGAYVANAMGDAWRAFGDGLLQWYEPAYRHVLDACTLSVLGLARSIERPDRPSSAAGMLLYIPKVVVATWRSGDTHHLQFREDGFHDPALRVDHRFLYSRDADPTGIPQSFLDDPPAGRIDTDPDLASVEYHQTLDVPPAFAGLLLITGGGALVSEDGGGGVGSVAAGYAWEYPVPLLSRVQTSLELEYLYRLGHPDRRAIAPRYALGVGSPVVPGVEAVHFEVGYAWGLHPPYKDQGVKWGAGIGTRPLRFPFTYGGVSARIKYERFWLDGDVLDGFQLQLVFR